MGKKTWLSGLLLAASGLVVGGALSQTSVGLFPNDAGPAEIDVSKYPKEQQENYRLFAKRCTACHTLARPVNSQFLELSAEEQKAAKADEPEIFADDKVWHVEEHIWNRYVRRMMSKPGCPVRGTDGKKIWEFLAFDSKLRKAGANRQAWSQHRRKLLADFKTEHPVEYEALFVKAAK